MELNKAQQQAVDIVDGPMLVVAGAGTGKTRVIVERLVRLVESGVERSHILALTFTEKAAQEMLDRVTEELHESYGVDLAIHTFNAFGQLLLEEFAVEIGLGNNLKLIGEEGKIVFLREHLDELALDYFAPVSSPDAQLKSLADYFSDLKQQLVQPKRYQEFAHGMPRRDEAEQLDRKKHLELAHAYDRYIDLMHQQHTIDYDDQIFLLVRLLESRANIVKQLHARYRYIMVDEFQDTNPMQSRLIDLLAGSDQNIMVVGDDDQSIYGWRGATLANILDFTKRYPKAKEVTLIENYRSTQQVLDGAYQLIQKNNPERLEVINKLDKHLLAKRGAGKAPVCYSFARLDDELSWIASDIAARVKKDPSHTIAVLARSRRGVARVHDILTAADIEHAVAGLGEDLYKQLPVLMMVDALRAVWEPTNNTALYHTLASKLFTCPPAILSISTQQARYENIPLLEVLEANTAETIKKAIAQIKAWHEHVHDVPVRLMAYQILVESGLKDRLYETAASDESTAHEMQSLGQWFGSLVNFERITTTPSVHSYLENFEVLRAEGETLDDDSLALTADMPAVMTIHKAKGLEWQTVYVIDCANMSLPYLGGSKGLQVPNELQSITTADARLAEERRLMYVAATRARDELIITFAERHGGQTIRKPSRFIEEMGLAITSAPRNEKTLAVLEQYLQGTPSHVSLPTSMKEGDLIVLSASQAEDYLDCPLNFYYKHILGVPEAPSFQTEVGSLFHSVIQTINEAKLHGQQPPARCDLLARLQEEWPNGYSSKLQRERALKHGLDSFEVLYDRLLAEPTPIAVEQKFRAHIPDSRFVLKGRIDAVLPTEKGVEVHDYKTSTNVRTPEDARRKTTNSQQLTMYAVAWRITKGEAPSHVSLDYVQTDQIGRVAKQAKSLDTMETKLAEIAEGVLTGKFEPGNQHDYCIHPPL